MLAMSRISACVSGNLIRKNCSVKLTFSGAAVKSPLIMGNDIRKMDPKTLSILSNPAIIAVSQDPLGSSASRHWLYNVDSNSSNSISSIPSIQMWSGRLVSTSDSKVNDVVLLLVNGGDDTLTLNATLEDIFIDSGPAGTAKEVKMAWEVRDLWAARMSDQEGSWIIGNVTSTDNKTVGDFDGIIGGKPRYNATKTSYAQGLLNRDERLLGVVTTSVQPSGTVTAEVEKHGIRVFRLRALANKAAEL
jgi:alpha-galactosidase